MVPILTLIFVVALSMFVTKVGTIALMHTGMSRERARFQARSAFSGAGFTTSESELVVKHPIRRRIILWLILAGNAGVVTAISSLILGFVNAGSGVDQTRNIVLLVAGISLLVLITRWNWLDRWIEKGINFGLGRFAGIQPRDFARILTVMEDYEITEVPVGENAWLADRRLDELKLPDEGLLVLGILRDDQTYIGIPRGRYALESGDRVFVYGKAQRVQNLAKRRDPLSAKEQHRETVRRHEEELREQDEEAGEADENRPPD